jgi:hypothetical protein
MLKIDLAGVADNQDEDTNYALSVRGDPKKVPMKLLTQFLDAAQGSRWGRAHRSGRQILQIEPTNKLVQDYMPHIRAHLDAMGYDSQDSDGDTDEEDEEEEEEEDEDDEDEDEEEEEDDDEEEGKEGGEECEGSEEDAKMKYGGTNDDQKGEEGKWQERKRADVRELVAMGNIRDFYASSFDERMPLSNLTNSNPAMVWISTG